MFVAIIPLIEKFVTSNIDFQNAPISHGFTKQNHQRKFVCSSIEIQAVSSLQVQLPIVLNGKTLKKQMAVPVLVNSTSTYPYYQDYTQPDQYIHSISINPVTITNTVNTFEIQQRGDEFIVPTGGGGGGGGQVPYWS